MVNPLFSIIIPTKNRYSSLLPVIDSILRNIDSEDFELVIQDNSDDNNSVQKYFNFNTDSRLKYNYSEEILSIVDNTILAIENAIGKYITFIGDDDFVSPYICKIVSMLEEKDIDCLIYNSGFYWWENVDFANPTSYCDKNVFWIPSNVSTNLVKLNSKIELDKVLKNGGVQYGMLPRFYHGIVKRSKLDEIKKITGTYLPGACPDMAFSISLSQVIQEYYWINYPVTIFGASNNSGAGMGARKAHFGKIEDLPFLPKGIIHRWDPELPLIWSGHTTNAQAIFEVFKAFDQKRRISYSSFYSSMLANEPMLAKYIFPLILKLPKPELFFHFPINFLYNYFKLMFMSTYLTIKFKIGKFNFIVIKKSNVADCMEYLKGLKISN
jgi:glycosyltransferase involved in cell wall biosynthesis